MYWAINVRSSVLQESSRTISSFSHNSQRTLCIKENGKNFVFFPFLLHRRLYRNTWPIAKLDHVILLREAWFKTGKGLRGKGAHNLVTRDNIDFGRGACYGSDQQPAPAADNCVEIDECRAVLRGTGHCYACCKWRRFVASGGQLRKELFVS
jgi:hypothetical protein